MRIRHTYDRIRYNHGTVNGPYYGYLDYDEIRHKNGAYLTVFRQKRPYTVKLRQKLRITVSIGQGEGEQEHLYHQLGYIKNDEGDYAATVKYHEKSITIKQKTLPPTHADLAISYSNIGEVYRNIGEYS